MNRSLEDQLDAQGFELGAQWYSYDGGLTWERCPMPDRYPVVPATMTITKIDRLAGEITVKVS